MGAWATSSEGFDVTVWPPQQALIDPAALEMTSDVPIAEAMRLVRPNHTPAPARWIVIDGKGVVPLNLLVIDFRKHELRRDGDEFEPPRRQGDLGELEMLLLQLLPTG